MGSFQKDIGQTSCSYCPIESVCTIGAKNPVSKSVFDEIPPIGSAPDSQCIFYILSLSFYKQN